MDASIHLVLMIYHQWRHRPWMAGISMDSVASRK